MVGWSNNSSSLAVSKKCESLKPTDQITFVLQRASHRRVWGFLFVWEISMADSLSLFLFSPLADQVREVGRFVLPA